MPHLTVQYTGNLDGFDAYAALLDINRRLAASGVFASEYDIKSRAMALPHHRVGTGDEPRAFVHAVLAIMPGRSEGTRRMLSETVLAGLASHMPGKHPSTQICVEVIDIVAGGYSKLALAADGH